MQEAASSGQTIPRAVSFIVPALNEAERIRAAVEIIHLSSEMLEAFEIILVDDGSTDATFDVMQSLARESANIRVLQHAKNRGLGAAYKSGLAIAKMPYAMMIPGDNSHPVCSITPILAKLGEADIVIPFPANTAARRPLIRRAISNLYTGLANGLSGLRLPYYNGTVVHKTDLIRSAAIKTDSFAYQLEGLVKLLQRGHSFVTVGVAVMERQAGRSNAFRWRNVMQVLLVFVGLLFAAITR